MALEPGTQLSHYEITDLIGKGGMGEVYRARDTRLGREVAIKVLPSEFARDFERLTRFEREAKLLASLSHPNIAAIHGLEEHEGSRFLVLELVEGDTLADRLRRGAIPVEESLKVALQIAEALEAAHEKGVIHRDLKPANIKITPEGRVKVLDFGLAKAFIGDQADVNLSNSPTLSMAATQQGVILGTAAYMSPEQAEGQVADSRSDVWSFGVVLFEMLSGTGAFDGKTVPRVLAAVLNNAPDWSRLPRNLHPRIPALLDRLLEKDRKDRLSSMSDARVEIQKVLDDPAGVYGPGVVATAGSKLGWVSAIVLASLVAAAAAWFLRPPTLQPVTRFSFDLPEGETYRSGTEVNVAVSPSGREIAFRTDQGTYIRAAGEMELRPLVGAEDATDLFFSPDGEWLGYISPDPGLLKKIPVGGGPPVTIAEIGDPAGANWESDGTIISENRWVSDTGGTPERLFENQGGRAVWTEKLPGTDAVLGTLVLGGTARALLDAQIAVRSPVPDENKTLFPGALARYVPTGHIVYVAPRTSTLFAVPFDVDRLEVTGRPVALVQGVLQYAVSDTGSLAYVPGEFDLAGAGRYLARVDRSGARTPLDIPPGPYRNPRISPDGTQLAIETESAAGSFISIYDLDGGTAMRRLTPEGHNVHPLWSPDGKRIAYASDGNGEPGIFWRPADGSGVAERLTAGPDFPESFSPDGRWLSFRNGTQGQHVWLLSMESLETTALLETPESFDFGSAFSPDGRWLTYSAGPDIYNFHLYAEPFPQTGERRRIGERTGVYGVWTGDGTQLIYKRDPRADPRQSLVGIRISTEPAFSFSTEEELFSGVFSEGGYFDDDRNFDVMPDGDEFIVVFPSPDQRPLDRINVVLGWDQELIERVRPD